METFSMLLAFCAGNSPVTGEFPAERPVARSFYIFFDLLLNKRLSKQSWGWWFEMPSRPLWRHCNESTIRWIPKDLIDDKSTWAWLWLGAVRQQSITWTNVDQVLWSCMASPGVNGCKCVFQFFVLISSRTQDSGLKLFIQQQNTWEYTKEMKSYVEQLLHYMVWHRCIKHSSKHSFSLWLIHVRRLPLRLKINRLHGSHHKSKGQGFKDMLSYLVLV